MKIESFVCQRLSDLGCEKLPREVRERIAMDFQEKVSVQLGRIAKRQITMPRVARAFVDVASKTHGVKDDLLILPLHDEPDHIAGT